jgi:predicted RND superfamily exporter protein
MRMTRHGEGAVRRPRRTLLAGLVLAIVAGLAAGLLTHQPASGHDQIVISLQGDLVTTLAPDNLTALLALEQRLGYLHGVKTVSGPGTYIQQTASQVNRLIQQELRQAQSAGSVAVRRARATLMVRYGYTGTPSLTNSSFVGQLVFGSSTAPKRQFAWLFPDGTHALVLVRPRAGLSDAQTRALTSEVRRLVTATPLTEVRAVMREAH